VIQVPPTVLGQLQEGWVVCADWDAFVPTQGIKPVLAKLGHLFGSLGQTQQKLQSTQESLLTLQRDSANESQALKELQGQRNQIRAEIIRAEAQIEMLKELFVSINEIEGNHDVS
jgi:septal ring factor EnvC (AmiA/AmiB activator)